MARDDLKAFKAVLAYAGRGGKGERLPNGQKRALEHLGWAADRHGITWLSVRGLASSLGASTNTARRTREALVDDGVLRVAEEVPGSSPMLHIDLPGLDGDTTEAWKRRRVGRSLGVADGRYTDATTASGGVAKTDPPGVAMHAMGGVAMHAMRSPIDPLVDPIGEFAEENDDNNNNGEGEGEQPPTAEQLEAIRDAVERHRLDVPLRPTTAAEAAGWIETLSVDELGPRARRYLEVAATSGEAA